MDDRQTQALARWLRSVSDASRAFADAITASPAPTASKLSLFVPAYFRDTALWDRLFAEAAAGHEVVAIVNPASGPGTTASTFYRGIVDRAAAFTTLITIGYVSTDYGKRATVDVENDITRWHTLYPGIKGIFFDEQPRDLLNVSKFKHYFSLAKIRGGFIASNPGTSCDPGYYDPTIVDALVLWEKAGSSGAPTLPAWAEALPNTACAGLVQECSDVQLAAYVPEMAKNGFGRIFLTSGVPGSAAGTWGSLGSFDKLLAAMAAVA